MLKWHHTIPAMVPLIRDHRHPAIHLQTVLLHQILEVVRAIAREPASMVVQVTTAVQGILVNANLLTSKMSFDTGQKLRVMI